ncbi:MAG: PolC-type DNA polymerase III [Clostridia bacterium]|nr:PolC-type DNA polymerase III [Clostridia bacterium]
MAITKKLTEIFRRYLPDDETRCILDAGHDLSLRMHPSKESPERVEIEMTFDFHVEDSFLHRVEADLRQCYGLRSVWIFPHFPPQLFSLERMREITDEAVRIGAITRGFFEGVSYTDDGETVTAELLYDENGVSLLESRHTSDILSQILFSRYGVVRKMVLRPSAQLAFYMQERERAREDVLRRYGEEARENARRAEEYAATQARKATAASPEIPEGFERVVSVLDREGGREIEEVDGGYRVGLITFLTKEPEEVLGNPFEVANPTPIAHALGEKGTYTLLGEVFEVNVKERNNGLNLTVNIGITDGIGSIYVKKSMTAEESGWLKSVKAGKCIAVRGTVYPDKYDGEMICAPKAIVMIKKEKRMDRAEEKRVELHLHTNMSAMDALISPAELVETAVRWKHKAVAVTDHGNVQSFPEVMLALKKARKEGACDLKVLYGMEAYFVNDTARAFYGTSRPAFSDEMVVFDLETTGLSNATCEIIEIGAVMIREGEVVSRYGTFVKPSKEIPEEITKLTGITNAMVADAPAIEEVLPQFLDYIGNRLLIAHNALFDVGFVRAAADRLGLAFNSSYLDTVALSRYLNPELKKHKLDIVAEHYGLGDFDHHRAADDAEMLANIFFCMQRQLREEGVQDFDSMIRNMSEQTDPLLLKPYHMILLAKNKDGLKNLYKLISASYLQYFRRFPRIPKTLLSEHREGLIVGSACEAGELFTAILDNRPASDIEEIASFYDYLEIQPLCNNRFLIESGKAEDEEALRNLNRRIVALGEKLGKPVVATCDAHFMNEEDDLYRKILLASKKFADADKDSGLYFRTTEEMLEEFSYLGEEKAREVVITNPNKIAEMVEDILPIPDGQYTPEMEGAEQELTESCWRRAKDWYGDPLPKLVEDRLSRELDSIIKHGFAVLYMIAVKLVAYSESLGYLVGSRGSVGSSFVATMSGISEVNPLPPHYRCPKCRHTEFFTDGSVGSGFDLDDKNCPECGTLMINDGHDIPFETFLGFKGDKSPDIDLNFSGDVQGRVHKYTEELFGEGNVFRAGTIGTLADKTAFGFVKKYLEERKLSLSPASVSQIVNRCVGIKRTTGQHPGGIIVVPRAYEVYDFTPVQHPADDPNSDIITTHFQFSYLHDTILKLDELGHDMPTKYKMLERYTNTSVLDVKMNDKAVYELFLSTKPLGIAPSDILGCQLGTYGLPEMGTSFIQQVLLDAKPKNFADLLQISGLTHGTNVWLGNAQDLIRAGTCDISEVVGTRDGIMLYLIRHGLDNGVAFKIMEDVRKGKGLKPEYEEDMLAHGVPEWYIASCKKIKYMFPKAHAAAYVMSAIRLGWYKIHYPMEFYAAFLTVAPGGFDAEIVLRGKKFVEKTITELQEKEDSTQKDAEQVTTLLLVLEAMARGIKFLPVSLEKSDESAFLPEDGKIRIPFNALSGLGDTAAKRLVEVRNEGNLFSIEELQQRAGLTKSVIEILRRNGVLDSLSETNQFTLF